MAIIVSIPDAPLREAVLSLLEAGGYNGNHGAASAEELIRLLDQLGQDPEAGPDCVIVSQDQSGLSGADCVRLVRSKPLWRDLPFIFLLDRAIGSEIDAALRAGAADFVAQPLDGPILLARLRQVLALKAETDRRKERERELLDVTGRLQSIIASLQGLSSIDALTGLANLRLFDDCLSKEWRRCLREGAPLSLLLVDLDSMTAFNTRYGRPAGDEALRTVAAALQVSVSRAGDVVARMEGPKFALLLPGVNTGAASFLAEKVRHAVTGTAIAHADAPNQFLTASVGVSSILPKPELRVGFLVAAAEEALFEAKRKGKDRVEVNALSED
jgi:diguanylate cyclase (GGDEF)-like protein